MALDAQTVADAHALEDGGTFKGLPIERRLAKAGVALQHVEAYAAGAPEDVKLEAAIRALGYELQMPSAPLREDGEGRVFMATRASIMIGSGAASLLSPWREHRAGEC